MTINNFGGVAISGGLSSGALTCSSISSQGIATNSYDINAGTGIIACRKLYVAHRLTAGWNGKCLVVGNAGVAGNDGFAVFGKNNGSGGNRYYRMGFNSGFDFTMGDYENTSNSSWVEAVKFNYAAPLNSFVVASSGFTGIGQVPAYRLTVAFGNTLSFSRLFSWFLYSSERKTITINTSSLSYSNVCAYFGSSVWVASGRFMASSDSCIKKNIKELEDQECLNKLLLLKPCKYKYIDETKHKGDKKVYGFITQELNEVIPEIVEIEKEYIPNIYKLASYDIVDKIIIIDFDYTKIVGKMLKIYEEGQDKPIEVIITEKINDNSFKVDKDIETKEIVIWGEWVEDFHTISKEYFHVLIVSSIQELHRTIVSQKQEIEELKEKLNIIMNRSNL